MPVPDPSSAVRPPAPAPRVRRRRAVRGAAFGALFGVIFGALLGALFGAMAARPSAVAPSSLRLFAVAHAQEGGPTAVPTQPRRPTRTPAATATPSPTPISAAALRADVWIDPPLPVVGDLVRLGVDIENRDRAAALDVTIDVMLPAAFVDATLDVEPGETARAGSLVRWHIDRLESGAEAALRIGGQATRATGPARDDRWCVLLLSYGSPVEHCMRFEAVASAGAQPGSVPLPEGADAAEPLPTAPTGFGLSDLAEGRTLIAWTMMAVGLVILGLWTGATMRARPADGPADGEAAVEAENPPSNPPPDAE